MHELCRRELRFGDGHGDVLELRRGHIFSRRRRHIVRHVLQLRGGHLRGPRRQRVHRLRGQHVRRPDGVLELHDLRFGHLFERHGRVDLDGLHRLLRGNLRQRRLVLALPRRNIPGFDPALLVSLA